MPGGVSATGSRSRRAQIGEIGGVDAELLELA